MGSSKKHKEKDKDREHKHKRKRRSRSRSKERRSRRKDREEKREAEKRSSKEESHERSRTETEQDAPIKPASSGGEVSLSIEETNRLRAKIGLKPLEVPGAGASSSNATEGDGEAKPTTQEDVHAPPANWGDVKKTQALKEKMAVLKQKRLNNQKLSKVKTLGDSDSDPDDISQWVKRSRKMEKEKVLAEKRAKVLEEMDEEFGISDLMEEEFKDKRKEYSSRDLQGLRVEHDMGSFKEGRGMILTLQDKGVLDEDQDDVLVNVNMIDDEKAVKNIENKKKKPEYKPYDEPEYDEYGMLKPNTVLDKYDEDVDGNTATKKSFQLGSGGKYDANEERHMEQIRRELRQQGQTLSMSAPTVASEYYTADEAAAKFKKVKKKVRKIRKKTALKADDLLPLVDDQVTIEDYGSRSRGRGIVKTEPTPEERDIVIEGAEVIDYGHGIKSEPVETKVEPEVTPSGFEPSLGRLKTEKIELKPMEIDDDIQGPEEDLTGVVVDDEEVENELHSALNKARKLKQKRDVNAPQKIAQQVMSLQSGEEMKSEDGKGAQIVMNSISEFCRNLGEIPTYGLSGNREEEREEIMDTELELMEQKRRQEEMEEAASGWNEVDIDTQPVDIMGEEKAVLEEEPIATDGVGAALQLAMKKGYLEKEVVKKASAPLHSDLAALYYSIEDKRYDDLDEKYRKRDRYGGGVITDFREKETYKPEVKLEYVDDSGRNLNPKEAFRQLSHRFHGKGSGKKKTEKRMKKLEEEQLMKQMSSTDTPLNTLSLLQDKQKAEKSPFVILSGGSKGFTGAASIAKP